jgi:hypothetical protein
VTRGHRALRNHAEAILDHELRRAHKSLAGLPEERRSALEEEAARVVAAVVDSMIQARREPSWQGTGLHLAEAASEPRLLSWAAD